MVGFRHRRMRFERWGESCFPVPAYENQCTASTPVGTLTEGEFLNETETGDGMSTETENKRRRGLAASRERVGMRLLLLLIWNAGNEAFSDGDLWHMDTQNIVPGIRLQALLSSGQQLLSTFRHWVGVNPYTWSYDFVKTSVFGKQSPRPGQCKPHL